MYILAILILLLVYPSTRTKIQAAASKLLSLLFIKVTISDFENMGGYHTFKRFSENVSKDRIDIFSFWYSVNNHAQVDFGEGLHLCKNKEYFYFANLYHHEPQPVFNENYQDREDGDDDTVLVERDVVTKKTLTLYIFAWHKSKFIKLIDQEKDEDVFIKVLYPELDIKIPEQDDLNRDMLEKLKSCILKKKEFERFTDTDRNITLSSDKAIEYVCQAALELDMNVVNYSLQDSDLYWTHGIKDILDNFKPEKDLIIYLSAEATYDYTMSWDLYRDSFVKNQLFTQLEYMETDRRKIVVILDNVNAIKGRIVDGWYDGDANKILSTKMRDSKLLNAFRQNSTHLEIFEGERDGSIDAMQYNEKRDS